MDALVLTVFLFLIPVFFLLTRRKKSSERLPPGSLGLPIIGQSLGFLGALRANTAEKWLEQRIAKYGPVSKMSLFGKPTVFIHGQAANKFVFNNDGTSFTSQQPESTRMILGDRNILELSGEDHKRVRSALMLFLKPESLKRYVGKMDEEIRNHLEMHWHGKQKITISVMRFKFTRFLNF
ncbi:taxoid 2-alpha-hydroxylase-like [Malus domestica]|uniref:taxoid 2-alpha-hydroxylase-like n=1 Tax=Malus domestica TaxID=3750 RepID=UPI00397492CF